MILALLACSDDGGAPRAPGEPVTDTFSQSPSAAVDVLWVVSEAPAAASARATLAAGIGSFQDALDATDTDWQIGVVSARFDYADPDRGTLLGEPAVLRTGDDLAALLPARLPAGDADDERGLAAAQYALSPALTVGGPNDGLVRPGAELAVVFVSTQDDEGTDPVAETVIALRELEPDSELLSGAGFVPSDTRYAEAVALLSGPVYDPADADAHADLGTLARVARRVPAQSGGAAADARRHRRRIAGSRERHGRLDLRPRGLAALVPRGRRAGAGRQGRGPVRARWLMCSWWSAARGPRRRHRPFRRRRGRPRPRP